MTEDEVFERVSVTLRERCSLHFISTYLASIPGPARESAVELLQALKEWRRCESGN